MKNEVNLRGLGVALVTPFNREGEVDYARLQQLVDVQLVPEGYVPGGGEEAVGLHSSQQLLVYPDPVGNTMNVRADGQWQNAEALIYDATGRQVLNFKMAGENTTVDVSKLAKGTYFVRFCNTATGDSETITVVKK